MEGRSPHIPRLLVRYRLPLFLFMTVAAVVCGLLIPHININTNMVVYLPDSSPMKQGMDLLEAELPGMGSQMEEFGSIFADGNALMPSDLPKTLALGVALLFVVLLIMSSSFMEVLLFLVTIGFAVVINMGTNALLPSVSMLTNTLTSVLQMVLSMDYSIILMNRFRQEKATGLAPVTAMENAVSHAAASILSSAFTTIVSLLMLCFMKIKIGADMGVVLAKGVSISLICNFTVLPCLIIWFDKAIEKTRKRPPKLSSARLRLAAFENRYRLPLALLFVIAFGLFFYLQGKTRTSFSPNWNSAATSTTQPDHNDLLLLYADADSTRIPALLDSLKAADPMVTEVLSYPSLVQRQMTAGEMAAFFKQMAGDSVPVNEELLSLVYYYRSHPQRDEWFRLEELMASVEELRAKGLVDRTIDIGKLMSADEPASQSSREVRSSGAIPPSAICGESQASSSSATDTAGPLPFTKPRAAMPPVNSDSSALSSADTTSVISSGGEAEVETRAEREMAPQVAKPEEYTRFTYEEATTPITAEELAALAGISKSRANLLYRLAGKAGQTMLPLELLDFVEANVLHNRAYASFIPKDAAEQLTQIRQELLVALEKGPESTVIPRDAEGNPRESHGTESGDTLGPEDLGMTDTTSVIPRDGEGNPRDSHNTESGDTLGPEGLGMTTTEQLSPLERLAEMYFCRHKYPSIRVYRALKRVGIPITQDELNLLYLYTGAKTGADPEQTMSAEEFLGFVADTLINDQALSPMLPDSLRSAVTSARDSLLTSARILRGTGYSAAVVMSEYDVESDESFAYIDRTQAIADKALEHPHYWIGGSEMYRELKAGFPAEVLLLTLLTVLAIFLIVAITFKSVLIPIPLIMTVLTGIYANVWAVGANGETMYFISYLIVQGILMGATIDYTILFTGFYTRSRMTMSPEESLAAAYDGALHSISTSGLILTLVPFAMSFTMSDAMICSILKSISAGAAVIMLLVLFVLPGVLAALDKIIIPAKRRA